MSLDWASASFLTRWLTATPSTVTASPPADRMPNRSLCRYPVITSELAMKVLDGTQSVSTQAPPGPASSTRVTSASSCAATRAASYPPGPPPMITIRLTTLQPLPQQLCRHALLVFSTTAESGYRHRRASLRRVWLKPRSGPHAGLLSALAHGGGGVDRRLAPDLCRRRGNGLGGRGDDDRRVAR